MLVLSIAVVVLGIGGIMRMQHSYRLQKRIESLELQVRALSPRASRGAHLGEHECRHIGGIHYCKCSLKRDHQAHEGHQDY